MDVHTKAQRSFNMSQVKSKNTKPEVLIFSLLEEARYKFEKHYPIAGKPDIVFTKQKVAIFIDGEFWHGKNYKILREKIPPFWVKKIGDNLKRDRRNVRILRSEGWHIMRFWDKKIVRYPERTLKRITLFLEKLQNPVGNRK